MSAGPAILPEWFDKPERHPEFIDAACDDAEALLGWKCTYIDLLKGLVKEMAAGRPAPVESVPAPAGPITGETSDGYHTFNELYEHRHALFAVACHFLGGWKSKLHEDGTMFPGWFIAGLTTSEGMATYHLPERLWDRFPGRELERAPAWDGHTASDVIERLWAHVASLSPAPAPAGLDLEAAEKRGFIWGFVEALPAEAAKDNEDAAMQAEARWERLYARLRASLSPRPAPVQVDAVALVEEFRSAVEAHSAHHNAGTFQTLKYAEEKMLRALSPRPATGAPARRWLVWGSASGNNQFSVLQGPNFKPDEKVWLVEAPATGADQGGATATDKENAP